MEGLLPLSLDPIEKKPLSRFNPGSMILSVGSYGCNLRCPFCQNYDISWSEGTMELARKLLNDKDKTDEIPVTRMYMKTELTLFHT